MDGIIFDVDGTLWDPTDTAVEAWNHIIETCSNLEPHIDAALLKTLFGKPMNEICQTIFPTLPKQEQEELGARCFAYENQLLETKPGIPYEGVIETLKKLAARTKLYVVSNCQCGYIELFLKAYGLNDLILDHLCFGDTQVSKGQTIRMMMERNQLQNVVYVGDTMGDYQACLDAEVPFIFAEYGFGDVPPARQRIAKFEELLQLPL